MKGGAAAAPGSITTFQVKNTSGSSLATPRISLGMPLAPGDVPSGSHIEIRANDGTTVIASQQDQESTWAQDGSWKVAALSFVSPDTFSTNQVITYQVWSVSGAPNRTPIATLANVAANSDIKAHFTGQTLGSDVFEVGVNDIITNGTNWPWGANPMRGWEIVRAGPICCEWRFWCYLRRTSDDAFHKWLKGWIYVRAWGAAGPFEIAWGVRNSNILTTNGTVGGANNDTVVFDTMLLDGATTLQAWGGSADPRVVGVASTAFNTTTKTVTMPTNSIFGHFDGSTSAWGGVPLSFSGTVGTGIDTSAIYWGAPYAQNPANTGFATSRPDGGHMAYGNPGDGPWQAGTHYDVGNYVTNDGDILYRCITAGTTAGSGGPTGNGTNITDGTAHWACVIAAFTTQGSGTITLTPHCHCFAFTGQIYLDQNAHRLWSGATRPAYEVAHDFTYLTTKSRALPPYISTVSPTADATLWTHSPGNEYFPWALDGVGDNVGDDRVGYLMSHEARLLYLPFDVTQHQNCRVIALTFAQRHAYIEDETVGKIPIMNNGHLRNGTTYANMGVCRPNDRSGYEGFIGNSPPWLSPSGDGYIENYVVFIDASHCPMPGYLSYLKTGDDLYREYMMHIGNMNLGNQAFFKQLAIGSITYQRLCTSPAEQGRGIGWGVRLRGNTRHLMPAGDPILEYWTDVHNEQALYMEAWRNNPDGASNPGGVYAGLVGPTPAASITTFGIYSFPTAVTFGGGVATQFNGYHQDMQFLGMAMEAWRGEIPEWSSVLSNYLNACSVDRVDAAAASNGCLFCMPVRYMGIWANEPPTVWPSDWDAAWSNVSNLYQNIILTDQYLPNPWTGCPGSGMATGGGSGEPLNSAPNTLANMNTSALAMFTIVGPPGNHAATLYAGARAIQYALSPPLSFDTDPTFAIGPIGATG
jgi:hypothetical protein